MQAEEQDGGYASSERPFIEFGTRSASRLHATDRVSEVQCNQRNRLTLLNLSRKQETLTELIEFFGMRVRGSLIVKRNEEPRGRKVDIAFFPSHRSSTHRELVSAM